MAFGNIIGYASGSTGAWHKYDFLIFDLSLCLYADSNIQYAYSVTYNHVSEMTLTEMFDRNLVKTMDRTTH